MSALTRWQRGARAMAAASVFVGVIGHAGPAHADQEKTVKWNENWPRVHLLEVGAIVALTIGSIELSLVKPADHAKWSKPILFDESARSFFKSNNENTQELAGNLSDNIYHAMVIAPYVVDNYVVALGIHQNADVALQMTLMNLQSLGLSGVISLSMERTVGRRRPFAQDCSGQFGPDKVGYNHCNGVDDFESFYSGHAAATFTMAGLTCAHHQHLPLYGGGLPDALACIVMVSLATTTGVLRLVVDRHWTSDVLTGAAVGLINGYVLPSWLHYGFGDSRKQVPTIIRTPIGYVAPVPQLYPGGAGLGLAAVF